MLKIKVYKYIVAALNNVRNGQNKRNDFKQNSERAFFFEIIPYGNAEQGGAQKRKEMLLYV